MRFLILFVMGLSASAMANPNYSLLSGVVGVRSIVKWDGGYFEGTVNVVASDSGVGFSTTPLAMGSTPVPAYSLITPSNITTLAANGNVVTQTAQISATEDVTITYTVSDGYYEIYAEDCSNEVCHQADVVATTGKAPGDVVDPTTFFKTVTGTYVVDLVAGAAPEASDNSARVDTTTVTTEADTYFPYCTAADCDLGFVAYVYTGTSIFHENLGTNHDIYTILNYSPSNVLMHYDWENNNGSITVRNFQYVLNSNTVCMEHVVHLPASSYSK